MAATAQANGMVDGFVIGPASAILEYARANPVDQIVLGARRDSALRNILGSVSGEVVAKAPCTVTVVRPPRDFDAASPDKS